jgi:hypothetical protein
MFMRSLIKAGSVILLVAASAPLARGGYYSTIDAAEETLLSRDYLIFARAMDSLGTIGAPKPRTYPPIRHRYVLIETMASGGELKLDTLAQKLDYGAVLIRRGRAFEAARFLGPVYESDQNNFLLMAQYASASFLSGDREAELQAPRLQKKALEKWPARWSDLTKEQQAFLGPFGFRHQFDFDHYRRCEVLFERLINSRLKEKKELAKKKPVEEAVDPIFVNEKGEPIRFVNEKGDYEAGRIAPADMTALPRDAVEAVEQLLIWMPGDERLLWLLAETFNASAMEHPNLKEKSVAIYNANLIFQRLTNFETPASYGLKEITTRAAVIQAFADANPINVITPPPEDPNDVRMTSQKWWQTLAVVMAVGIATGMFAIWQVQEMRRRRQARAAKG